ncbi:FtsB family cell division protein [Corynebacterium epidermidicanis]|uniref:Septum formation initiator n=1 Tax=Corynebacterium epidermidicanis TaxID=1050174 RepID=A0A0G3GQA8_9CORY|nr:septum formation initiator family protein [Corynebacterium epidermidicanis]AKK02740.1 septum formation initiator [Corynebacterium epidermidicanis]
MTFKFANTRVPVANQRQRTPRPGRAVGPTKKNRKMRFGVLELGVALFVMLLFLLTIAIPLRNYFEQRNEIKRVSAAIVQKQQRKEDLLGELEKYRNEAYVQEQARNRLGVIAPGEVAFRVLDPQMQKEDSVTTREAANGETQQPWFDTLWGAISTPEQEVLTGETPAPAPEMHMPIKPTAPVEKPAEQAPEVPANNPPAAPGQ